MIWQGGQFAWPLVLTILYLALLLLATDYAWRVSRLGGRRIALLAGAAALLGTGLLWVLWP